MDISLLWWHYLALFRGVPIPESPFKKRVRANHEMRRYTFLPGAKKRGQRDWPGAGGMNLEAVISENWRCSLVAAFPSIPPA